MNKKQIKGVSGPWSHCVLCGCHGKHNKSMVSCVSQIRTKTNHSRWPKTWHAQTIVFMQRLVWYAMNNMSGETWTNFPRDGRRNAVIGTKQTVKMTKIKWPCRGTVQCSMASWINHLYMKITLLIFPNNPVFIIWTSVKIKWYHQLHAQNNI